MYKLQTSQAKLEEVLETPTTVLMFPVFEITPHKENKVFYKSRNEKNSTKGKESPTK